jgi:hypothetical protein
MIDKLPPYLYCDDCPNKHYLSLNKDVQGKWSIGYVEYESHQGIYTANEFRSINEAAKYLLKELKEYKQN